MNLLNPEKINIWSQTKSRRIFVGTLSKDQGKYLFCYNQTYVALKGAIPLGPEFPLIQNQFTSKKLFPTFIDRIPEKENPSYGDYCRQWGIDPEEKDPFVLLTTIGRRGPSTFVFEPDTEDRYNAKEIEIFREKLTLNQREFSALLGLHQATLARLETGKTENDFALRYIKLCAEAPEALMWLVEKRGQYIHDEKRAYILDMLKK